MKLKTTLIAVLSLACTAISNAFMIDFDSGTVVPSGTNIVGQPEITDGSPLVVNVNGYGTVTFSIESGADPVSVGNAFAAQGGLPPQQSLEMYYGDVVKVTFDGNAPLVAADPRFAYVGSNAGIPADAIESTALGENVWELIYTGGSTSNGAGVVSVTWDVVPEPSSAALGALGMSMILLRRRRA